MLYYLLPKLTSVNGLFFVFTYITVRSGLALFTAFFIVVVFGRWTIKRLARLKLGQVIRDDGPETHLNKAGTPTMGGILIVASILVSTLLWAGLADLMVLSVLIVTLGYGAVGFADDYLKIRKKNSKGLRGAYKILLEAVIAIVALLVFYASAQSDTVLLVPLLKNITPDLGWFYLFFSLVVILGSSNAVNLTDGLDGLAIVPVVIVAGTFGVIAYLMAWKVPAEYLHLPQLVSGGELTVFMFAVIGAGLGFLWFNCHPAQVFMGDVGALSLGGAIGMVAVITKHELVLLLVGGIFVVEALSVILQVGYFKATKGKRIFRMAPLHHHFEQIGWPEEKVIVRFWIVQVLLALASLATLKLR